MECPFCKAELNERALACRHCGHDVSPQAFGALHDQVAEMAAKLTAMQQALQALAEQVEQARISPHAGGRSALDWHAALRWLAWVAMPICLLLLAHWTIIDVFDLDTGWLRVASILIPLPFGFRRGHSLMSVLWAALVVAAGSVAGMLIATAITDQVPILPHGVRDWAETLQYAASIGLALLLGRLLGAWHSSGKRDQPGLVRELAVLLAHQSGVPSDSKAYAHHRIATLAGWINTIMVVITAVGAMVTAFAKFWH